MDNVILLADKTSHSWDFANKIKNYIREQKQYDIPLEEISITHFKNGEINIHIPGNIRKKEVYFIQDPTKNPQEWWIELLLVKDTLLSASAESLSFILPDMLYSRKDRKEKSRVPISARALANSISSGLKRIITMDLHASQIQGFYPEIVPLDNLYSYPEVVQYLKENNILENSEELVVVSPDAGGVGRARSFAERLQSKYPVGFIDKRRLEANKIEEMRFSGDVYGKNVLIVDDIIDTGGTLCKASKLLKEKGAQKIYCYGTHGIFSNGTRELLENFDKVMISNTHYILDENILQIDVSSVFAEALYRTQKGLSISELFY